MDQALGEFLRRHGARYEVLPHPAALAAQAPAAAVRLSGWEIAKVLVVRTSDGYVLAVLPACCVVDLDGLKGLIGPGDIRLATVDEVQQVVANCAPGAIPPFGALFGLRTFVDRALLDVPRVTMAAGDATTAVRMGAGEFRRLLAARTGDFAVHELVAAGREAVTRRSRTRRAS